MKKILNKLLIIFALILLIVPAEAASYKRVITPVLYNNIEGSLEYRLYDEPTSSKVSDDKLIANGQSSHLYAYGKTLCYPGTYSEDKGTCQNSYQTEWSYLVWASRSPQMGSTETDYTLANNSMKLLVNSYNEVINFYKNWGKDWLPLSSESSGSIGDIKTLITTKKFEYSGWTISIETLGDGSSLTTSDDVKQLDSLKKKITKASLDLADFSFAKVSVSGPSDWKPILNGYETSKIIIWGVKKPIRDNVKQELNLEHLCWYASAAAQINSVSEEVDYPLGMFADNGAFEEFNTVTATEEAVNGMFGSMTSGLTDMVGFDEPESLIFNQEDGSLKNRYLGMMPLTWWNASNTLFWFFEIIAVLVLFASIINSAMKQSMASISPNIRNTLKDSIANLGIAIILLILYAPMFYILAKVNSMIVSTFASFTSEMSVTLMNQNVNFWTGLSWFLQIAIELVLFFVNAGLIIKINLDYFIRSISIMLLHIMAPVAIASISFDNRKTMFNNWLKELIGNIFMQSFNALVLAVIMIVMKGGSVHWWYNQAALFAIASLNSWFMNIFGLQNSAAGMADRVQSQASSALEQAKKGGLVGAVAGAATGAVSGVAGAAAKVKFGADAVGALSGGSGKGNFNTSNASKTTSGSGGPNKTGPTTPKGTGAEGSKDSGTKGMNGKFNAETGVNDGVKTTTSQSEPSNTSEEKGQEEMREPSFVDKAKVFGAAMVASSTKNDYVRKAMNDYIGYNPERDRNGEKGYFGYQSMGVANKENDKHVQQQKREQEQKRREEEQRERDKKLNEIYKATARTDEEQQKMENEKKEQIEILEEQERQNSSSTNIV